MKCDHFETFITFPITDCNLVGTAEKKQSNWYRAGDSNPEPID